MEENHVAGFFQVLLITEHLEDVLVGNQLIRAFQEEIEETKFGFG